MKKIIIIFTCFLLSAGNLAAQTIDLRTGVDAAGYLLWLPATDLGWEVAGPYATQASLPTTGYTPAKVTNDWMFISPNSYPFPPQNGSVPPVAWLSRWVNLSNEAIYPGGSAGYVAWRRTFDVPLTCVQSAVLHFWMIGVDNKVTRILVNGTAITIPTIQMWYTYNLTFNIQSLIIPGQQNTLIIETENYDEWSSLKVHGELDLRYCGTVDFALRDKNRVEKDEFCLEEDVFLDAMVQGATSYMVNAIDMNTSVSGPQHYFSGNPTNINLTSLYHNYFPPGNTVKVQLYVWMSCGMLMLEKTFKFKCCGNSANAAFTSVVKNGVLSAQALGGASHDWKVYKISAATGQLISPYPQWDNLSRITKTGSTCYLVRHEVNNACGTDCKSQRVCQLECAESNDCNLPAPTGTQFNQSNATFSWNQVPGAVYYVLEITKCDPACCVVTGGWNGGTSEDSPYGCTGDGGGGGTSTTATNPFGSIVVYGTSKVFNAADYGWTFLPGCFSWRVYAVCENGSKSPVSSNCATLQ